MPAVTFDTLKFVETLKEAGVPETQAKAFSTAVRESHEAADVATKEDITDLRHEIGDLRHEIKELETGLHHEIGDLRHEIKELETSLRHEMKELDLRRQGEILLLKWMFGLLIAGVVTLLLKAFFGA